MRSLIDWGQDLNLDIMTMVLRHPVLASIGGNTGKVNSFAPIDIANLSGGAFTGE